eukprot:31483-Pelagococcus_subviridis.AAC.12
MLEGDRSTRRSSVVITRPSLPLSLSLLLLLQQRERDHVSDARAVRQQHHEPVHAQPHPPRRRHAVFQRGDEIFVELDRVVVVLERAQRLLPLRLRGRSRLGTRLGVRRDLPFQPLPLIHRVRQLAERVGELAADDEQLEAFGDPRLGAMRLRERGDLHRVVEHERRLSELRLHARLEHLVQDVPDSGGLLHVGYPRERFFGSFHTSERRGGVQRRQLELNGVEGGD